MAAHRREMAVGLGLGLAGLAWAPALSSAQRTVFAPALIGAGWLAHAVWDAIHHEGHGPTEVRTWYPPLCAMADLVIGVALVAGWI